MICSSLNQTTTKVNRISLFCQDSMFCVVANEAVPEIEYEEKTSTKRAFEELLNDVEASKLSAIVDYNLRYSDYRSKVVLSPEKLGAALVEVYMDTL